MVSTEKLDGLFKRVADAEAALAALHAEGVDALVGPQGTIALAGRDNLYKVFFEAMNEGSVTLDASGFILHCNRSFSAMIGLDIQAARGQPFVDFIPPHESERVWARLVSQEPQLTETTLGGQSARTLPVQISNRKVLTDSKPVICMVVTDLSERKRLEKERLEVKAAEAASLAKSAFLANMSHEIRTPLNGVLGLAQIGYYDSAERENAQETFASILDCGKLLLTVVNDILDFSKIEAGKLSIESTPFDPAAIVEEVLAGIRSSAVDKELGLASDIGTLPGACLGDPVRIQQVLFNLLSNAIKFTETGEVRVAASAEDGRLVYTVTDTGVGIPPDVLERIFLPFEQADNSTTRTHGGTGLGLSISRRLVELMGGDLSATSDPGRGSSFRFRLPLTETDQTVPDHTVSTGAGTGRSLGGIRLLVVEDNEVNRIVLEHMLESEGAEVFLATNGLEAVEAVEKIPGLELVLMDVQMPEMDGLEATRRINASRPDLDVVGQTAHALKEEHDKCLEAGMVQTLTKPIALDVLVSTILNRLNRTAAAPATLVPPASDASKVIDWRTLEARYAHLPDFIDRLVKLSIKGHGRDVERIAARIERKDFPGIAKLAYELKVVSGNMEAGEVHQLAVRTMNAAGDKSPETIECARALAEATLRFVAELKKRQPVKAKSGQ